MVTIEQSGLNIGRISTEHQQGVVVTDVDILKVIVTYKSDF